MPTVSDISVCLAGLTHCSGVLQVLAMLFDLDLSSISTRQLGQHATHHMWASIMQDLAALCGAEVTLQQVR